MHMSFKMCESILICKAVTHQECAEHVEADKVEDGKAAATGQVFFWGGSVRLRFTPLVGEASQHYLLPRFTGSTSARTMASSIEPKPKTKQNRNTNSE